MNTIMSSIDKLEIKIMDRIDEKIDAMTRKFDERIDRLQDFITKNFATLDMKYATKEELHSFKDSMRIYKNAILFISGATATYMITYTLNTIFHII